MKPLGLIGLAFLLGVVSDAADMGFLLSIWLTVLTMVAVVILIEVLELKKRIERHGIW